MRRDTCRGRSYRRTKPLCSTRIYYTKGMDSLFWARFGSGLMLLAVMLGAFGAHALKTRLSADMLVVFETGVRYQVYHALGILAAAWIGVEYHSKYAAAAACCCAVGILFFSGSLYALAFSGIRKFGAITPIGGLLFIIGWAMLAFTPSQS